MISQLESPCFEIRCDGCGEVLDREEEGIIHYASVEEATEAATDRDWTVADDGTVTCMACVETEKEVRDVGPIH